MGIEKQYIVKAVDTLRFHLSVGARKKPPSLREVAMSVSELTEGL